MDFNKSPRLDGLNPTIYKNSGIFVAQIFL